MEDLQEPGVMKIAIDARWIFQEISGIGAYTRELIQQLAILDNQNDYFLLFNDQSILDRTLKQTAIETHHRFKPVLLPYGIFSLKNQLHLPRLLKKMKINLYHSTNYMIPLLAFPPNKRGQIKSVTTIHDVIPMIFPGHAPKSKKAQIYPVYQRLMIEIGRRSDTIITDSIASAKDITHHLQIHPSQSNKVKHVYCGVSDMFKPPLSRKNAPDQILYVGRSDPYKNITTLIRAFEKIKTLYKKPLTLTIAGSVDNRYPEPQKLAEELGIADSVIWTGYISDSELVSLYQNSSLLIHPSRYEGFGLQILEAMSCGLPVICANKGSQPEVAGDAAIVLDPDDEAGIVDNALKILTQPATAEEMRKKGYAQATHFSWRKTAEQTLNIYMETCNNTGLFELT